MMQIDSVSQPYKSLAAAILFGLLLGPIGLLYGSLRISVIAVILCFISLMVPKGVAVIFFFWALCPYINVFLVNRHNRKMLMFITEVVNKKTEAKKEV